MNDAPALTDGSPEITHSLRHQGWTRHTLYTADSPEAALIWLPQWLATLPTYGLIGLVGNLGAGKTTLMQQIAHLLDVSGPVTSPTFSLVQPLHTPEGTTVALHADLYRCKTPHEAQHLVFQQWLEDLDALPPTRHGGPWFFIEWPELLGDSAVTQSFSGVMVITPSGEGSREYTYWAPPTTEDTAS